MAQEELRIGVFVCDCGLNIAGSVDTEAVRVYAEDLPDVVVSVRNKYTCADPGQQEIKRYIREYNLNRVVVASCTPRMHESTFRACIAEVGLHEVCLGIRDELLVIGGCEGTDIVNLQTFEALQVVF